ncbi:acyl dehydratase [Tamaricihabitans halophyticus]|uniref:UPF0336 protein EV191_105235 n=1 Tax=Tamaricihabitans halophyticus TaxID=1262583 RepID=A0A4R2QVP5_9PSEU|nr:MaoC family dehydratase N-terminal domain-containing protein [Tamaricihabitans halophyticus]TCP53169.1 acyl dehydratase [Tamaricihabitans halophyticus]
MPLDQSFIGRSYPPTETYGVSRAKIREFATAIGDDNPVYHDLAAARAAGHPDLLAPPTFLTIINLGAINTIIGDPELGLDYGRMVHGDQRFVHHRPTYAGADLTVTTYVEDIMARAGNDFLTLRAEIRDSADELITTTRAQLVVRGESS